MNPVNLAKVNELIQKKDLNLFQDDIEKEVIESFNSMFELKIKKYANKKRALKESKNATYKTAKSVLSNQVIKSLPTWVRDNLKGAKIFDTAPNTIQISDGRKYNLKNKLNDLTGSEWTYFLNSVITTRYLTSGPESYAHNIRKIHPSPKPPQLMADIIKFFTKENELVFDYFMGVGGTLLGASLCNRKAVGIDLEQNYIDTYKKANQELGLKEQQVVTGDSVQILKKPQKIKKILKKDFFSLILIDPPYGDMMSRKKTGEIAKKGGDVSPTPFTNLKNDLGNLDWRKFRDIFSASIEDAMKLLKQKGHIVVFIKDLQPEKNNPNLLHADIIRDLCEIKNLNYLGTKIWADQSVNLYPYGYPYSFVSNQIHQYILIFKKSG